MAITSRKLANGTTKHSSGEIIGYKVRNQKGETFYTVGSKWPDENRGPDDDDGPGLVFDYKEKDAADMREMVCHLMSAEADLYVPDPEEEAIREEIAKRRSRWWSRLHEAVEDIGISLTPFEWRMTAVFIIRPDSGRGGELLHRVCKGVYFGPLKITW